MEITLEQARDSLTRTLEGLRGAMSTLDAARADSAGDHLKLLEVIGPVMASVQHPVIEPLGFPANDEGLMQYTVALKSHDSNEEISLLMAQIHMLVLFGEADEGDVPKLALPSTTVSYEEVLLSARGAKPPAQ